MFLNFLLGTGKYEKVAVTRTKISVEEHLDCFLSTTITWRRTRGISDTYIRKVAW
jgi:hypothetical protein